MLVSFAFSRNVLRNKEYCILVYIVNLHWMDDFRKSFILQGYMDIMGHRQTQAGRIIFPTHNVV